MFFSFELFHHLLLYRVFVRQRRGRKMEAAMRNLQLENANDYCGKMEGRSTIYTIKIAAGSTGAN